MQEIVGVFGAIVGAASALLATVVSQRWAERFEERRWRREDEREFLHNQRRSYAFFSNSAGAFLRNAEAEGSRDLARLRDEIMQHYSHLELVANDQVLERAREVVKAVETVVESPDRANILRQRLEGFRDEARRQMKGSVG